MLIYLLKKIYFFLYNLGFVDTIGRLFFGNVVHLLQALHVLTNLKFHILNYQYI